MQISKVKEVLIKYSGCSCYKYNSDREIFEKRKNKCLHCQAKIEALNIIEKYEKLPDEKELRGILGLQHTREEHMYKVIDTNLMYDIAQAIAKRIKGE